MGMQLKVGELAERSGLTVRTLHHYDAIGLLKPSARTQAGHRLYGSDDVERLHRISSLRQLGLSLADIGECIDGDGSTGAELITRQIAFLRQRIEAEQQLVERLEAILGQARDGESLSTGQILDSIEMTTVFERTYSEQQRAKLAKRSKDTGSAGMQAAQQQWAEVFAAMNDARLRGLDPADASVQKWAQRAQGLIESFTGGDPGIKRSLTTAVQENQTMMYRAWGIDEEQGEYYSKAMAALGS